MKRTIFGLAAAIVVACGGVTLARADEAADILTADSFWRVREVLRQETVGESALAVKSQPPDAKTGLAYHTEMPPDDWISPEFDDAHWIRATGAWANGTRSPSRYGFGGNQHLATLCLRGKFTVSDPEQAAGLKLSLVYRGGVAVWLNGREIARAHLPAGKLNADTQADAYPFDTYVKPDGNVIRWGWGDPGAAKERCEQRIRKLENIALPPDLLRKGVNVLAIQTQRAPVHPKYYDLRNKGLGAWSHLGMLNASLVSPGGAGVVANLTRPSGIQVWNTDINFAVYDTDYGDPNEQLRPIRLFGARNGAFAGQVAIGADVAIEGLTASAGELRQTGGGGTIPVAAQRIGYPVPDGSLSRAGMIGVRYHDGIADTPPAAIAVQAKTLQAGHKGAAPRFGAVQPIWYTVHVPVDAPAGAYEGRLTVSAKGLEPVAVPIRLQVADWRLPDPKEWTPHAGFIQSPESVALRYEVPLWSDRHFELLAVSLRQLRRVGGQNVYLHLLGKSNHGNAETIVRWVRGQDGTLRPDFTVMDRYLDLWIAEAGKPRHVIFYVWEGWTGGGYFGAKSKKDPEGVLISVLDPATGKTTLERGPRYDKPEAEAFWRPVCEGLRQRLRERGLEERWLIGVASDVRPSKEVVDFWKKMASEATWTIQSHGLANSVHGVSVSYGTIVWGAGSAVEPNVRRMHAWKQRPRTAFFNRDIWRVGPDVVGLVGRVLAEQQIQGMQNGFGRMNGDLWPCVQQGEGKPLATISARFPESDWRQLNVRMAAYLHPGPGGALPTTRYELIVEGLQECEARIFIQNALLDEAQAAKLGSERVARLQELLDERTRALLRNVYEFGWQDSSAKLYAAAAEVAGIVK